jgi:hypothetical protein
VAKIVQLVDSCRDCPNRHYYSGGTYECLKTGAYLPKSMAIPTWCPLPDHPAQRISELEARVAQLEEEDRQWDKSSLVQMVTENAKLREFVRHKPDCQRHGFLQCTCGFAQFYAARSVPRAAAGRSTPHDASAPGDFDG